MRDLKAKDMLHKRLSCRTRTWPKWENGQLIFLFYGQSGELFNVGWLAE